MQRRFKKGFLLSMLCGVVACIGYCMFFMPVAAHNEQLHKTYTHIIRDISLARFVTVKNIRILHLYGSSAQMGEQHGRLLKEEIHTLRKNYLDKFLGPEVKEAGLHAARNFFLPHIPADYQVEMQALADAADIDFETVLLAQCFLDINRVLACSTIAIHPRDNALNESLLLRNLDFPSLGLAEKHSIIIVRHPSYGQETVTVGWPLLIGTLSGFNQDGLALAMMESYGELSAVKGMPYNLRFRHCLEQCSTTAEMRTYFKNIAITAANNLTCIDRSGDAAVFELSSAQCAIRDAEEKPIYATNHFTSEELDSGKDCYRYERLKRYFNNYDNDLNLSSAETLLADVALKAINLQSFIILPESQRLHISLGKLPACDGPFVTLNAKDLGLNRE